MNQAKQSLELFYIKCGNYSREETIQGRKLLISYILEAETIQRRKLFKGGDYEEIQYAYGIVHY